MTRKNFLRLVAIAYLFINHNSSPVQVIAEELLNENEVNNVKYIKDNENKASNNSDLKTFESSKSNKELDSIESAIPEEVNSESTTEGYQEGLWGTVPWAFDEATNTITLGTGEGGIGLAGVPWRSAQYSKIVQKIIFTGPIIIHQGANLFYNLPNLEEIEHISQLDISKVNSLAHMFQADKKLERLDLSSWDVSHITDISYMFSDTYNLNNLNIDHWNTSKVKSMYGTFWGAKSLTNLNINNWDTSNVTDMQSLFEGTHNLINLNISNWNTSKVVNMSKMFNSMGSLKTLDISNFDTSSVENMNYMFSSTSNLNTLTLGDKFKFSKNSSLDVPAPLNIGDKITGNWTRQDGKSKGYSPTDFMANYGSGDLTAGTYVAEISEAEKKLLWGTAPWSFDTDTGVLSVEEGQLSAFNATENPAPWNRKDEDVILADNIKEIVFTGKVIAPNNSKQLFADLENLLTFTNLQNLNTSNVVDMTSMFVNTHNLTSLNLNQFNTSNVTSMANMFAGANSLNSLDLSNFNTDKVADMTQMFAQAKNLTSLDLSSFNTKNVKDMSFMFNGDIKLEKLNLSSFDTSNVVDMMSMFYRTTLNYLTLGKDFRFKGSASLGVPGKLHEEDKITEKWIREDGKSKGYLPKDFMENYGQGDLTSGTYVAQMSHFGFKEVPEKMSFMDTKISNRTILTQRQDSQWKMIIEDTRRGTYNWHVTAKMEEGFKDSKGNILGSDLLLFRKNGQDDQWINSTSETVIYEGKSGTDEHDISWSENEGPLIQTAPGTVKVGQYKGTITWSLVDAP
ncbi:hypothetical protein N568_0106930 [Lactococcus garvieae TRF1]|uniref:BspA family leucine-rich repeat surface protein n=1 Tax=Lactococcus garvieae TRF1 TaxID=1380772 RepID=V8AR37_9LACT|nr:hypothetical protein N568_0106930 [Lactococcus garvieae TRF1]